MPSFHTNWNNGGVHGTTVGDITSDKRGIGGNNNNVYSGVQFGWEISTNGGGYRHNNMPPYLVVTIWKRTA